VTGGGDPRNRPRRAHRGVGPTRDCPPSPAASRGRVPGESAVAQLSAFEFECGESIPSLEVAYETYGDPHNPPVLVCHALTGGPEVATRDHDATRVDQAHGWWADVVGPEKFVDTDRYYVVCANVPGSCYGTTGPASTDPETGRPYGPDFPPVTVGDWTRAQRRLLDHLGVDRLHAVVGGSVGGMNVVEWARRYPDRVDRVIPIATAARLDPQMVALSATARRAITGDPNWQNGRYYGDELPREGLAQARRIGHVTYLSKGAMAERFGRGPARRGPGEDAPEIDRTPPGSDPTGRHSPYREVESYLDYNAARFADRFDANSYLYLSRAMEDYDLARDAESDADALAGFDGELLLLSFTGDWHFPVSRSRSLEEAFRSAGADVTHEVIDSDYGHDAFLVEPYRVGPHIAGCLGDSNLSAEPGAPVHAGLFR